MKLQPMKFRPLITGVATLLLVLGTASCGVEATDRSPAVSTADQTSTVPEETTTTVSETTTTTEPPTTTTTTTTTRSRHRGSDDHQDGHRPTVAEIKTEINKLLGAEAEEPGAEEIVDCLAREFHDSDLPNGVLRKIIAGEDAQVDKKNEDKYEKITEDIEAKCTDLGD